MSPDLNFLITLSDGEQLFRVAIKIPIENLKGDAETFYMEPENKKQFFDLLPPHCQSLGKIVEIKEIFEVVESLKKS